MHKRSISHLPSFRNFSSAHEIRSKTENIPYSSRGNIFRNPQSNLSNRVAWWIIHPPLVFLPTTEEQGSWSKLGPITVMKFIIQLWPRVEQESVPRPTTFCQKTALRVSPTYLAPCTEKTGVSTRERFAERGEERAVSKVTIERPARKDSRHRDSKKKKKEEEEKEDDRTVIRGDNEVKSELNELNNQRGIYHLM